MMQEYVYALRLQQKKFYVGKTKKPWSRIKEHFSGKGCWWTKKFQPLDIHIVKPSTDLLSEDSLTVEMMNLYGMNNVRGGSFSKVYLDASDQEMIKKLTASAFNLCFNCGDKHFTKDCKHFK